MLSEMDDFPGLLAKDFGFRAQGKAAPMAGSKGTAGGTINFGIGSSGDVKSNSFTSSNQGKSTWNSTPVGNSLLEEESLFRSSASQKNHGFDGLDGLRGYNDVYGGPPKYSNQSSGTRKPASFDYDAMFQGTKDSSDAKPSSLPVYDKPVYDDDIFDGVPGIKSTAAPNYDDVFATISSPPKQSDHFDDLLGSLGKSEPTQSKVDFHIKSEQVNKGANDFEDLLPGFAGSRPPKNRSTPEIPQTHQPTAPSYKSADLVEDPFVIIEPISTPKFESPETFTDPLEQIDKTKKAVNSSFAGSSGNRVFEAMDPLDDLAYSVPSFSFGVKNEVEDRNPSRKWENANSTHGAAHEEPFFQSKSASPKVEVSPKSEVTDSAEDIWITVSEVPLFTQPTSAPPPSRPPPPKPVQVSKADHGSLNARNGKERVNEFPSFHHLSSTYQSPPSVPYSSKGMGVSSIDELEDFAKGRSRDRTDDGTYGLSNEEEVDTNSAAAASAAAMKEAMDRAEAKFKYARELRERESAKTAKNSEASQQEKYEKASRGAQDQELREKQERFDLEQREREEKERLDREKRRLDREREQARQVVERSAREARERTTVEARLRAQKVAVEKATAEARERAERAAVQRAQAEARERAAAEAKERAERAAAEARERSNAEARERAARAESEARVRAERASVERAAREARERAAREARERATTAAAASREQQQKNENDLEAFFSMGSRASSAPRPNRTTTAESPFDSQFQNKPAPEVPRRTPPGTSSTIRKASSTTNIVDDLTSVFGGATPSGQFQEIAGESDERRRARLERHQRTQERAAKALAEKNERDLQTQRDQAERHRIAETLDIEIKRWSTGKEGNLRALLSTLQYVLWPECGWQAVSLTDLITAAAVKKVYRKATLCIHPDKVQQKGATLQQKCIAEKVFDLLKEAYNKFNSEELF